MKRVCLFSGTILSLIIQPCFAYMGAAKDALAREDYVGAAALFQKLAEQGDKKAQAHLGYMYYVGEGVAQDYAEAIKWYKKAAILGDRDSQYNLAVAYAFGQGIEQDYQEALQWYRRAAEQGHKVAQYSLGISYAYGEGTTQNQQLAAEWFKKSADQGYVTAQNALNSIERAMTDANKPALIPDPEIDILKIDDLPKKGFFGRLFGKKDETDSSLEPEANSNLEPSDEAYKQPVSEHTEVAASTAAEQKLEPDPVKIETQLSGEPNIADKPLQTTQTAVHSQTEKKGFLSWLFSSKKIFDGEESNAEDNMEEDTATDIVEIDTSTEPTVIAKLEEPEQSEQSRQSSARAQSNVDDSMSELMGDSMEFSMNNATKDFMEDESGEIFAEPIDLVLDAKNTDDILNLRSLAAKGNSTAQLRLAILCHQGKDVQQDNTQAFLWYRRAAEQGLADAQYNLGNMYLLGEGIEQDDFKAQQWYKKAAAQGHQNAQHNLDSLQHTITTKTEQDDEIAEEQTEKKMGFFSRLFGRDEPDEEQFFELDNAIEETDKFDTHDPEAIHHSPENLYARGLAFELGEEVLQNYKTAFKFFKQAADLNHAPAQYKLGVAYAYGQGTEKDPASALAQYKKSADQGHALAQRALATLSYEW